MPEGGAGLPSAPVKMLFLRAAVPPPLPITDPPPHKQPQPSETAPFEVTPFALVRKQRADGMKWPRPLREAGRARLCRSLRAHLHVRPRARHVRAKAGGMSRCVARALAAPRLAVQVHGGGLNLVLVNQAPRCSAPPSEGEPALPQSGPQLSVCCCQA